MSEQQIWAKLLAVAFSLLILLQAYGVRKFTGTWLCPACLFGLFWFFMTFVPLVALWWIPISPIGTGMILLYAVAFSCSAFLFKWKLPAARHTDEFSRPFIRKVFYLSAFGSLACAILNSLAQGISLNDLIFNTVVTAAAYRDLLSSGQINVTLYLRVQEILAFLSAVLGGMILSSFATKKMRAWIMFLSFASGSYIAVAQSSKWTLFSCLAMFYAGILVERASRGEMVLLKRGSVKKLGLAVTLLVGIAAASFLSRGLQNSDDSDLITNRLEFYFASYSCEHLYGFSDWLAYTLGEHSQISYTQEPSTHGFYTFMTLYRTLGYNKAVPAGTFDDYYSYEDTIKGNIYTAFRGMIQDFGILGSVLVMFLIGASFNLAFHLMLRSMGILSICIFLFATQFIYSSFGVSIFTWSWIYFTFPALYATLYLNRRILSKQDRSLFSRFIDFTHASIRDEVRTLTR